MRNSVTFGDHSFPWRNFSDSTGIANTPPTIYAPAETGQPIPYLRTLAAHKGTLVLFAVAGALLGALVVWRQPYIFQSHLFLEVRGINEDLLNKRELDPSAQSDNSSQSYVNTEARILRSGPLFEHTAASLNKSALWTPPVTAREIARAVRVRTNDGDRILEVISESTDPKRSAAIANGLAQEFIQQDLKSRVESSQATSVWLSQELADLAGKLQTSENALRNFTTSSNLLIDGSDDSIPTRRFREVQDELVRAEAERISKESLYEDAKSGQEAGSTQDNQADQMSCS